MRLSILIFDGLTTLDVVGGYEVLARVPGIEVEFVAAAKGIVAADTRRLGLLAYRDFDEVRDTDILYVPGGPGARVLEDDKATLDYLRALDATSTWTVGICNGVTLLAATGLLRGVTVTTNWFDQQRVAEYGARFVPERYRREGKYVTGAGVSASIDTGLYLAQLLAGDQVARAIRLGIEYYPAPPPLGADVPGEEPEPIQRLVQAYDNGPGRELLHTPPPFAKRNNADVTTPAP